MYFFYHSSNAYELCMVRSLEYLSVMRHMSANRQWKDVDERDSGNIFANNHWYHTHISRIFRVRTTQTSQRLRKTAHYLCVKPSPGIAHSTDPAKIGVQLRRFHVRKTDELRKSRMYRVLYLKFVRNPCVYATFGQYDRALSQRKFYWGLVWKMTKEIPKSEFWGLVIFVYLVFSLVKPFREAHFDL
jgi:hypothetical protein